MRQEELWYGKYSVVMIRDLFNWGRRLKTRLLNKNNMDRQNRKAICESI